MNFERIEKKYVLNEDQYRAMVDGIKACGMHLDSYGKQTVSSIYFDTDDLALIRTSTEKPFFKEKLRIRCYGVPTLSSPAYLEVKKKYDGVVFKRRIKLTLGEAYAFEKLRGTGVSEGELKAFSRRYEVFPKVLIGCERTAYRTEDSDLRITFDGNLRYRTYDLRLEHGSAGNRLCFEGTENFYVMEIKSYVLPLWLVRLLDEKRIFPRSFSKYGEIYKSGAIPLAVAAPVEATIPVRTVNAVRAL